MKKLNTIFLFFIIASLYKSLKSELGDLGDPNKDKDFYSDYKYMIVYLCAWCLLIEVSIIIILHFKQTSSYVANHSFINLMIVIGQLVNNILFHKRNSLEMNDFLIAEMVIFGAELMQLFFGGWLNSKLMKKFMVSNIFISRFIHRNFGRLIYLARKVQVLFYSYKYFEYNGPIEPNLFLGIVIVFILLTHILVYFLVKGKTFDEKKFAIKYLMDYSNKAPQYSELLRSFESNDLDNSLTEYESMRLTVDDDNFKDELMDRKDGEDKIKWAIIEDRLFDITKMRHPKGNYIIEALNGRDITREIYGLKSWRFENRSRVFRKITKHKHSSRTMRFLMKDCIGPYQLMPIVMNFDDILPEISTTSMDFEMLNQNITFFEKKKLNKVYYWNIDRTFTIGKEVKIMFVQRPEKNYFFNISSYWLDIFGKYFLMSFNNIKQFYYPILSLSPEYIKSRTNWLKNLDNDLAKEVVNFYNDDIKQIEKLTNEFDESINSKERNLIKEHKGKDIYSFHLPLVSYNNKYINKVPEKFGMKGPLGLGLGINANTTHKYMIFVKDEGILPIVDFLEFLTQRSLVEMFEDKTISTHPVFHKEYFYSYVNDTAFWIYWEISNDSKNPMRSLGMDSVKLISKIYKKDTEKKVTRLLKNVSIVSKVKDEVEGDLIKSYSSSFKTFEEMFNNTVNEEDRNSINRYVISGDNKFVDRILTNTKEPLLNFRII